MADDGGFLEHVTAGEPLRISAATWNALIDGAKSNREGRRSGQPSIPPSRANQFAPVLIRISNTASGNVDLDRFSVVGLGDPVITTDVFEYMPTAIAHEPGTTGSAFGGSDNIDVMDSQTIAVLLEPIPAGGMGFAMVSGVVKVFLDGIPVEDDDPDPPSAGQRCNPKLGETDYMTVATFDDRDWGRFPIISVDAWDADLEKFPALIHLHDTPLVYDSCVVRIRHSYLSAVDPLTRGQVIALSAVEFSSTGSAAYLDGSRFSVRPLFDTIPPADGTDADQVIGIVLTESIAIGGIGLAVITGAAETWLNSSDPDAPFLRCDPVADDVTSMTTDGDSGTYGRFRVIARNPRVGDEVLYLAVVMLEDLIGKTDDVVISGTTLHFRRGHFVGAT